MYRLQPGGCKPRMLLKAVDTVICTLAEFAPLLLSLTSSN